MMLTRSRPSQTRGGSVVVVVVVVVDEVVDDVDLVVQQSYEPTDTRPQ
jgi:hypothetical protein